MRGLMVGAAALLVLAASPAGAQTPSPPKGPENAAERELPGEPGPAPVNTAAEEEALEALARALPPAGESPAAQLERIMAEERRREILRGKDGPFLQARTAWEAREWAPLIFAAGTLMLWGVGLIVAIWIVAGLVSRLRRQ